MLRRNSQASSLRTAIFAALLTVGAVRADDPVTLQERFGPGQQYHISMRTDLTGTLTRPAEKDKAAPPPLEIRGDSVFEYDERILAVDRAGQVEKTIRLCRRMDLQRTVGDKAQSNKLRPEVRRLVVLRNNSLKAPFSPDGPLLWSEIDLMRSDTFTPVLVGLLPAGPVRFNDGWSASNAALQELTGLDRIEDGRVDCKLEQVGPIEKRRQARVGFSGSVRGISEDGLNRHQLQGYLLFDLESNHISYLYLKGVHSLLDKDGKEVGRNEGRFVLKRQLQSDVPELAETALRDLTLEPNADNTLLLYDNPNLGVRFLYPRRWFPSAVRGRQLTIDSADGNGLLLTLEPVNKVPTGAQFLTESRDWLQGQKAKLVRTDPPRQVQAGVEHFALEAEMGGQKFLMDYFVVRQDQGGATLAARLLPADQATLQKEVEQMARSLVITRRIEDRK
jgi:hypothetical protein